ncbi:thioredoxin C-1-like [Babylonia areolata]|uniref:thioredoxin C-1-like n=1 Tax=Babylonia areolata TaxID=304850 RepID=UPI003FD42DFA
MASRHFFRRLSPILRNASRVLPLTRSATLLPRHAVLCQDLASRLTSVRCMTNTGPTLDIVHIQDADDFQQTVLESKKPVIVDFHANWCGPCKLLGPRMEQVIAEEKGRVLLAKVDIDELVEIAMELNVESVPTIMGFKDGSRVSMFIGLKEDDEIRSFVKSLQ